MQNLQLIRKYFQSLSVEDKSKFLLSLSPEEYIQVRFHSDTLLRDNQIITPGEWRYWLFVGGRGTGKSFCGASEIRKRVYKKQKGLCIVAANQQELIKVMIPAIQKEFPDHHRPKYIGGDKKIIQCHNGITIDCRTSQQGGLRGPNLEFIWLDELVNCWDGLPSKIYDNFRVLDASVRKARSQILITTTGNSWKIFKEFYEKFEVGNPIVQIRNGKMTDNDYISASAKQILYEMYGNSRYASLELDGIIDFNVDGALWTQDLINKTRKTSIEEVANPPNPNNIRKYSNPTDFFRKFVIGVDPATTSNATSDAWGITVLGLGYDNHVYVIEDRSKIMSPPDAVNLIAQLHNTYRNAQIACESNNVGEFITYLLRTKLPNVQPKLIHAHQNKMTRAQAINILWDQSRAHIVGKMPELESEMCEFNGDPNIVSPNRLDAMVHGAQWLTLEYNVRTPSNNWMPQF